MAKEHKHYNKQSHTKTWGGNRGLNTQVNEGIETRCVEKQDKINGKWKVDRRWLETRWRRAPPEQGEDPTSLEVVTTAYILVSWSWESSARANQVWNFQLEIANLISLFKPWIHYKSCCANFLQQQVTKLGSCSMLKGWSGLGTAIKWACGLSASGLKLISSLCGI
jgi:hypothetical protein